MDNTYQSLTNETYNIMNEGLNDDNFEADNENEINENSIQNQTKTPFKCTLGVKRTAYSHSQCFICKKSYQERTSMVELTYDSIIDIYGRTEIFVKHGTRCCNVHLDGSFLKDECIEQIEVYKNKTDFTIVELEQIFKSMAKQLKKNTLFKKIGDFKNIQNN
jgi:hypothetical protein